MSSPFTPTTVRTAIGSIVLIAVLSLAGCGGHSIQTTSGKDYLEKHKVADIHQAAPGSHKVGASSFDQALRHVAAIEPTLTFPARIGIAKMGCVEFVCGSIQPLHPEEVEAWTEVAINLGASYGTIMPINPLIMDQVTAEAIDAGYAKPSTPLEKVRLAAARQHLDVVIAYEVQSRGQREANALAVGDWTLIGAYVLPSRKIESEGYAAGIIIDPISGYPYGQIEAAAEDQAHSTWANSTTRQQDLEDATAISASVALAAETEEAFRSLRLALAEQKAAAAANETSVASQ